jgi:hypothetical protein
MRPFEGRFPFSAPLSTLHNLNRATSYFPAPNPFCMPKITINGTSFELVSFSLQSSSSSLPVGSIVEIRETSVVFAVKGGTMTTDLIRTSAGVQLAAAEFVVTTGLSIGDRAEIDEQQCSPGGLPVHA